MKSLTIMDQRHVNALRRAAQADRNLEGDGEGPQDFGLLFSMGKAEIVHPRWDGSWAPPSEHDIDDLAEMGLFRITRRDGRNRTFALTMKGREHGRALDESVTFPATVGDGRAPDAEATLRWLVAAVGREPAILDVPSRIIEQAVIEGVIDFGGREALARRVLQLHKEGYLSGTIMDFEQITPEQSLARAWDLTLTMKAHEATRTPEPAASGTSITVLGDLVDSQIAAGSINNITTFVSVLVQAEAEIDALDGVEPETKEQAKGLIRTMLGRGARAGGQAVTDAAGALAAGVISKLLGLPLS